MIAFFIISVIAIVIVAVVIPFAVLLAVGKWQMDRNVNDPSILEPPDEPGTQ